jgi:predicted enzyme related to lactoylglutathione lyase
MKSKTHKTFMLLSIVTFLSSCITTSKNTIEMEEQKSEQANTTTTNDTTPKVTGVGGIFFYAEDPKAAKDWYTKNLGIEVNDWGSSSFESRNINNPEEINSLQWKPFKMGDEYFAPSKKEFMINYQVQNIEGMVKNLKANGVTILDTLTTYDYGKFIHIMDAEGNKIELWEPVVK